jgi:hypothetical protein
MSGPNDKVKELSQEEVFSNDIDPLEAIAAIRREEGVPEEDIIVDDSDEPREDPDNAADGVDGDDELDNLADTDETDDSKPDLDDASEDNTADDVDGEKDLDDENSEDGDGEQDENGEKDVAKEAEIHKFTANGQEFEFTADEIFQQFGTVFGQSMDYTKKMQAIAPYRKMISALETEGVSSEQLNLAIDALKGNKQALQKIIEDNKFDAYDLTDEGAGEREEYKVPEYGKNDVQLGIEEVTKEISNDEEYKITVDVIDRQWDDSSRDVFASNPKMIKGLHNDIKSGIYDKVAPVAMKMKVLDGNTKSDLEYYMLAGQQVSSEKEKTDSNAEKTVTDLNKKAQDAENEFDEASSEAQRKRSASPTRGRADRKGVIDYLDDDDENYDAWYKNLQASH